jgi:type I restriction enzyme S subunit
VTRNANDLPSGWSEIKLGELKPGRGESLDPRRAPNEIFEIYSVPAFPSGEPENLKGADIGSSKQKVVPGAVLLCGINPRINRVWVVSEPHARKQIASTEWIAFKPTRGIAPKYLRYFLEQDKVRQFLAANASGVGGSLMRVKGRTCSDFPFPIAPAREQERIVAEIEKQLTRLDAAVAALKRVQANLKRYRASVLKAACEGRLVPTEAELACRERRSYEPASTLLERILAERRARWEATTKSKYKEAEPPDRLNGAIQPEGWIKSSIEQLADVGTGATPLRSNQSYWDGGTIPWVTSGALNQRIVREPTELVTAKALKETNLTVYPAGTLLVAMYGEGKTRGKCAELEIEAATNQAIAALEFAEESVCCRAFVRMFLEKNYEDVRRQSSGGVQPNLNLSLIKRVVVPLPPIAEQARIVDEVEKRLSVVDEIESQVETNLARAIRLRQSVLRHAFEGKLVPQDPLDEPAGVLLETIRGTANPGCAPSARGPEGRKPPRPKETANV